ncbi:Auxin-induced in root cultures protein 12 [Cardamine amara subsp. amara]|uniref:Auxin-induced in root cultures protein 12 n=1 Tax=Cardamine amara subsp. amara TaxID=228776 RepID=A0ABD1BG50_CARAN
MASPSNSLLILTVACFVSLISPAISQTCNSQNLGSAAPYEKCMDLPVLDSYLHYTYDASNSSLSVAFVATPTQTNGWIAWGINPTGTKMAGTQAFLAYRSRAGAAPVVTTYNISGYNLDETARTLNFEFWNLRAESLRSGAIVIFTTVKVPAGDDGVNQVWQIGGTVTNGRPSIHGNAQGNLNSHNMLSFTADAPSSAPTPATGGSTTPGQAAGGPGNAGNAGSLTTNLNFGVNLGILVLLGSVFIF